MVHSSIYPLTVWFELRCICVWSVFACQADSKILLPMTVRYMFADDMRSLQILMHKQFQWIVATVPRHIIFVPMRLLFFVDYIQYKRCRPCMELSKWQKQSLAIHVGWACLQTNVSKFDEFLFMSHFTLKLCDGHKNLNRTHFFFPNIFVLFRAMLFQLTFQKLK